MAGGGSEDRWRDGEKELREQEVRVQVRSVAAQRSASWTQVAVALAAVVAAVAAAVSAYQAKNAVDVAQRGIVQQDVENQLSTAVSAIGGHTAAERVAGVTLLGRNVAEQLAMATSKQERQNANELYSSALIVLANYIRSSVRPITNVYSCPNAPLDAVYAADELEKLINMTQGAGGLRENSVAIDLSNTELCQQPWAGIRFDKLSYAYLWRIDLRGANLQNSKWGTAYLAGARLQCADLRGADLSRATLRRASLRGADVAGAQLPNNLKHWQLIGIVKSKATKWDSGVCLHRLAVSLLSNHHEKTVRSPDLTKQKNNEQPSAAATPSPTGR